MDSDSRQRAIQNSEELISARHRLELKFLLANTPNNKKTQRAILTVLWEASPWQPFMRVYFTHYNKCINRLMGNHPLPNLDWDSLLRHWDVVVTVKRIMAGASRDAVFQECTCLVPSSIDSNQFVEMCASVSLMAEVTFARTIPSPTKVTTITWDRGSLKDATTSHFCPQVTLPSNQLKLESSFTARNLSHSAGIGIVFSLNLADHLRVVQKGKAVVIFHCVGYLDLQLSRENSLYPASFLQETLRTLHLLFPLSDKETKSWLKDAKTDPPPDAALVCGDLNDCDRKFENFVYWHDRLVLLKQTFDEVIHGPTHKSVRTPFKESVKKLTEELRSLFSDEAKPGATS